VDSVVIAIIGSADTIGFHLRNLKGTKPDFTSQIDDDLIAI
jgi:hypothetical protein